MMKCLCMILFMRRTVFNSFHDLIEFWIGNLITDYDKTIISYTAWAIWIYRNESLLGIPSQEHNEDEF